LVSICAAIAWRPGVAHEELPQWVTP